MKRFRDQKEKRIQGQIITWLRFHKFIVWHSSNMGFFNARTRQYNLVDQWHLAGVPDLTVLLPGARTCFIEVKAPDGVTSPEQFALLTRIADMGHRCLIARSVETVERFFREQGYIK